MYLQSTSIRPYGYSPYLNSLAVQSEQRRAAQQQPQQQQQSMNPMGMLSTYNQINGFWGGEDIGIQSLFGGGETAAGSSAGGGGGGASTGLLSNPWTWLAAVVVGNEYGQSKAGNRPDSGWAHAREALTGEVLERDLGRYFGGAGEFVGKLGNPSGTWDLIKDLF